MNSITIIDIAKLSGVSVSTVSRAINNHPDISSATKNKIMSVIKENNYAPNTSARNLKRTTSKTIAVLIKGISNPFFSNMIKIFEEEIKIKKYTFILHKVDQRDDEIVVAQDLIREQKLKGIIFLGGYFSHSTKELNKIDVPFVLSTVDLPDKYKNEYSSISVDNLAESYKMINHICKKGHKRIAILAASKSDESIGKLRLAGYKMALERNGIEFDKNLCFYMNENIEGYTMENGYDTMSKIYNSSYFKDITAIFAVADSIAIGACSFLSDKGLKIPEDISVAGFDGLDISKYYIPKLTTIKQPVDKMARATIKLLFQMIDDKNYKNNIIFSAILDEGQSVKTLK
ncbi:MAG: LacI family DNA-binding transcriptional regulator [Lachnospirales bacterium]